VYTKYVKFLLLYISCLLKIPAILFSLVSWLGFVPTLVDGALVALWVSYSWFPKIRNS
jgi:hypothetical protein